MALKGERHERQGVALLGPVDYMAIFCRTVDVERQPGSNAIAKLAIERAIEAATIEGINRDF
jgi:hypothetical protein